MIFRLIVIALLTTCSLAGAVYQQDPVVISGTITASGTQEKLGFVRVREPNTRLSVLSDRKGRFELLLPATSDSVVRITFT
ncbi:MAG: hypothetical protein ACK45E_11400, partial [Ignavibacteria bacterium]